MIPVEDKLVQEFLSLDHLPKFEVVGDKRIIPEEDVVGVYVEFTILFRHLFIQSVENNLIFTVKEYFYLAYFFIIGDHQVKRTILTFLLAKVFTNLAGLNETVVNEFLTNLTFLSTHPYGLLRKLTDDPYSLQYVLKTDGLKVSDEWSNQRTIRIKFEKAKGEKCMDETFPHHRGLMFVSFIFFCEKIELPSDMSLFYGSTSNFNVENTSVFF